MLASLDLHEPRIAAECREDLFDLVVATLWLIGRHAFSVVGVARVADLSCVEGRPLVCKVRPAYGRVKNPVSERRWLGRC